MLAAAVALVLLAADPAYAQGSRFDSMFDDARDFLGKQLNKLDDVLPQRGKDSAEGVPVPAPNPSRKNDVTEKPQAPPRPVQPIQPPAPEQAERDAKPKEAIPPLPVRGPKPKPALKPADEPKTATPPPPKEPAAGQPVKERAAEKPTAEPAPEKATDKPASDQPAPQREPEKPADIAVQPPAAQPESAPVPAPTPESEGAAQTADAEAGPILPKRNPARTGEYKPPPPHPSKMAAPDWTEKQIAAARAQCDKLLSDKLLNFDKLDPIRTGLCGTPAPVKLSGLEVGNVVEIAPAAIITCPLADSVHRWMRDVVQPAARKHLGSPIASIRNVASYACRNRYGGARRPLSEHAKVNALDIAAFKTQSGDTVVLLKHWNLMIEPEPEPKPAVEDDKPEGEATASIDAPKDGASAAKAKHSKDVNAEAKPENVPQLAKKPAMASDGSKPDEAAEEKSESAEPPPPPAKPKPHPKSLFLKEIHAGACGIFGTALGPEANRAHRDHFHYDGAERRSSFCE